MKEKKTKKQLSSAVVRFCGDSGDGMQLTGSQFSNLAGLLGNDLMTFPDFPAEIRAPQGTIAGVSGFQIHFAREDIYTPGDQLDILIAMNPAALKANLNDLRSGGLLILNENSFDERNLKKAKYESHPLEGEEGKKLRGSYGLFQAPITQLTLKAVEEVEGLARNQAERCKNFFALGMSYWLFERDIKYSMAWIESKFKSNPAILKANQKALAAGYYFAETSELFPVQYQIEPAQFPPGLYRSINGARALALGLLTASEKAKLPIFYSGYPITPASEILHEIASHRTFGVTCFQAEDEIAAVSAAIGASYGGHIAVTASAGPGIMLKGEAINLAVITELPLLVINAQRGGPSTGLPTKTEQSDLFLALFGRSGESPVPVLAPESPGDSFGMVIEAVRIALKFMTPVFLLSDLYLIMGSEPWRIPDIKEIDPISNCLLPKEEKAENFAVYARDPKSLARKWVLPGTPDFEHRIGGLEKDSLHGNVNYDPDNHQEMVNTRAQKIQNIANFIPKQEVFGDSKAKLLVIGWGSSYGVARSAVMLAQAQGHSVAHLHLRYINPLPLNLKEIVSNYERILIAEMNLGQLALYLQGKLGIEAEQFHKVKGQPFFISELKEKIFSLS